jgi:Ca2+-binding EF-hand superfamily protein
MAKFSDQHKVDFKALFAKYDKDGNGVIDKVEFKKALKDSGFPLNDLDIANLMCRMDSDKSGDIDFNEFRSFNLTQDLFDKHDVNKDGFIGPEEITNVLVELGYKHLTKEKVKGIVESLDTDKNGKLDFNGIL